MDKSEHFAIVFIGLLAHSYLQEKNEYMNVASLKLCKELYEASGWNQACFHWVQIDDGRWTVLNESDYARLTDISEFNGEVHASEFAYDLGFIYRELPDEVTLTNHAVNEGAWVATYYDHGLKTKGCVEGPTPEDALCGLAIELFKSGVMVRDTAS